MSTSVQRKEKKTKKRKRAQLEQEATAEQNLSHPSTSLASSSEDGGFRMFRWRLQIPLAPVHSGNVRRGVSEVLDSFVTKYIPSLGAVLLTVNYDTLHTETSARLVAPTAIALVTVLFEGIGWRPKVGSKISGRMVSSTRSHVSLLIHNTFNASIATQHMPPDRYRWDPDRLAPISSTAFVHGLDDPFRERWSEIEKEVALEDLEINSTHNDGPDTSMGPPPPPSSAKAASPDKNRQSSVASTLGEGNLGCWIDRETDEPLGGSGGQISFTVIGLTIANATISVHGSLFPDPFNHLDDIPQLLVQPSLAVLQAARGPSHSPLPDPRPGADVSDDSDESDQDDDDLEEAQRPAYPLLDTPRPRGNIEDAYAISKQKKEDWKVKKRAAESELQTDADRGDAILMDADKDDSLLQDPEQLPHAVDVPNQKIPEIQVTGTDAEADEKRRRKEEKARRRELKAKQKELAAAQARRSELQMDIDEATSAASTSREGKSPAFGIAVPEESSTKKKKKQKDKGSQLIESSASTSAAVSLPDVSNRIEEEPPRKKARKSEGSKVDGLKPAKEKKKSRKSAPAG